MNRVQLPAYAFLRAGPVAIAREEAGPAETAIRAVLDEQAAAWNKGDLQAFMKGYWNSKELTFYSGKDKRQGWEETLERYKKRYQSDGKEMGKLSFTETGDSNDRARPRRCEGPLEARIEEGESRGPVHADRAQNR